MASLRASKASLSLSLFEEQPSILMRLTVFSVFALCLMVGDARFDLMPRARQAIAVVTTPLERVAQLPVEWGSSVIEHFSTVEQARVEQDAARVRLAQQSLRAALVENLMLENQRLRALLKLSESQELSGRGAQVLYELPDPYSQRLIVDRGLAHSIKVGSPVVDEHGVLGQVTRVLPLTSEITLLTNQGFTVSIINARTGIFGLLYGNPVVIDGKVTDSLELRYMPVDVDARPGDLLITSGIDGVYPSGLPVARIMRVTQNPGSSYAMIWCEPIAAVHNPQYVMIVDPGDRLAQEFEETQDRSCASRSCGIRGK